MNLIKQALNTLKNKWQICLAIGALAVLIMTATYYIPIIGGAFIAIEVFIFHQLLQKFVLHSKTFQTAKHLPAVIVIGVLFFPSLLLMGSGDTLVLNRYSPSSLPSAFIIYILVSMIFFFLATALELRIQKNMNLVKALDTSALKLFRNLKNLFLLSFYSAGLLLLSKLTWGVGYALALPLISLAAHTFFAQDTNE